MTAKVLLCELTTMLTKYVAKQLKTIMMDPFKCVTMISATVATQ